MTAPAIEATDISKRYGSTVAVAAAGVTVAPGQLVALLGPSGSGKTTLLRTIAGLEVPDSGTVAINGRVVVGPGTWVEPEQRRVGMVFQDGALFPHLTVEQNVGFGERNASRVTASLELVGLAHRARSYPHELSGGERQRVALARALAPEPEVVLLDEPFTALDANLRVALRADVAQILAEAGASALLVTHDQQEALSLASVVVVMRAGRVEQVGAPEAIYAAPASPWVASFLGEATILRGVAVNGEVRCGLGTFPNPNGAEGEVDVVVRPEAVTLRPLSAGAGPSCGATATVLSRSYFGHDQLVRLALPSGEEVQSRGGGGAAWHAGETVTVVVDGPVSVHERAPA